MNTLVITRFLSLYCLFAFLFIFYILIRKVGNTLLIPKEKLTILDYKILQFIAEHSPILKTDVLKAFPQPAAELCLLALSTPEYRLINGLQIPIENTRYISFAPSMNPLRTEVGILPLGEKIIEEYQIQKQLEQKEKLENFIWKLIPILLSIASLIISAVPYLRHYIN